MPLKDTLYYFDIRGGRGEALRYLLAYNQVDYEDHRVQFADWPEYKKSVELGFLPLFELKDGSKFGEMATIARYIAEKHGGRLESAEENAHIDQIATYVTNDIVPTFYSRLVPRREGAEKKANTKIVLEKFNVMFPVLHKLIGFDKGKQWASGTERVTYADFIVAAMFELFDNPAYELKLSEQEEWGADFKKHLTRVHALPGVEQWVAKRPETPF